MRTPEAGRGTGASAPRSARAFVLLPVLLIAAVATVLTLQSAQRAHTDVQIARRAFDQARADLFAESLLEALLDDLAALLDRGEEILAVGALCADRQVCATRYPRVQALLEEAPEGLAAEVSLVPAVLRSYEGALTEAAVSEQRLSPRALELRAQVTGSATALHAVLIEIAPLGLAREGR